MRDRRYLYVIELDPVRDENARWYVGITTDIGRRMYEHFESRGSTWTSRNEPVGYHIIGRWWESTAREYEHELTGLLMEKYGQDTTRGGKVLEADTDRKITVGIDDPSPELLRGIADTDNEGLLKLLDDYPVGSWRTSPKDGRILHELAVYENTEETAERAHEYLEDQLDTDLHKYDVREAIYRVGMENIDDVEEKLQEWAVTEPTVQEGYGTTH